MPTKVFFITQTGDVLLSLYIYSEADGCTNNNNSYHRACILIEEKDKLNEEGNVSLLSDELKKLIEEKYKWPSACSCGYEFTEQDLTKKSIQRDAEYSDEAGNKMTRRNAPIGAIWNADWMASDPEDCGPDGLCLIVRLPNGNDWTIDSRASNCDSPCVTCGIPYKDHEKYGECGHRYEDAKPHKCWVRHGDPKAGTLHVDKNGVTCGAGAGSIQSGDYHGFLHNGHLT